MKDEPVRLRVDYTWNGYVLTKWGMHEFDEWWLRIKKKKFTKMGCVGARGLGKGL